MDLIIILVLLIGIFILARDIKFVVYMLGVIEIFCRIMHYLGDNLPFVNINPFVNTYIPKSTLSVVSKYTTGIVCDVLCWVLVIGFIVFLVYLIKYLIKRK